jgi:peptidoglycan/LPS O-acetylase OafA/YrhL
VTVSSPLPDEGTAVRLDAPGRRRLSSLDGLRAILCIALFGLHANVGFLRAAWLTVDGFFVLSGFLITGLLLKEWDKYGQIDIVRFLKSRTVRLFPILLVAVLLTAALYAALPTHLVGQRSLLHSAVTSLTYTQNIFAARHPGLHDPLLHTWSLSQEQQFYALWPFVLGALLLRGTRHRAIKTVLGLSVLSSFLLLVLTRGPSSSTYFWPWTRFSGLALGAALSLALSVPTTRERLATRLSPGWVGLPVFLLFLTPFVVLPYLGLGPAGTLFVGVSSVTVASALLIGHLATGEAGLANRLLTLPPLVMIGRWSYCFYLVHLPLLIVLSQRMGRWTAFSLAFALSLALAGAMHHTVEKPLDRLRHRVFPV